MGLITDEMPGKRIEDQRNLKHLQALSHRYCECHFWEGKSFYGHDELFDVVGTAVEVVFAAGGF